MIPLFRAWDASTQKMVPVTQINWMHSNGVEVNGSTLIGFVESVMQCTGSKDKNGVAIYEGDILHWDRIISLSMKHGETREDVYAEVVRGYMGFMLRTLNVNRLRTLDVEVGIVVGNVYANPELCGGL